MFLQMLIVLLTNRSLERTGRISTQRMVLVVMSSFKTLKNQEQLIADVDRVSRSESPHNRELADGQTGTDSDSKGHTQLAGSKKLPKRLLDYLTSFTSGSKKTESLRGRKQLLSEAR